MTTSWRRALWLVPLAIALLTARAWCGRTAAPAVQAVAARRAPLQVVVSSNGKVEPVDDIEVRARLDGRVVDIPDPGKVVAAGEVMVRFDDGPVTGQVAAAESERLAALESLRVARATAAERQDRLASDRDLQRQGALTRQVLAESERAAREAAAQVAYLERDVPLRVAALDTRIAELRAQREATVVRAPFAGTIYRTQAKKGELVHLGDPLLWLADLDHLRVRANVDQVDLGRVRPGQPMRVTANAFPGRAWSGTVSEVVPNVVVKESRSVSESLARLDPPTEGLVPGMTVDVEIVVAEDPNALQVPAEAVQAQGREAFVYRVDGRRLHKVPVRMGLTSVSAVAIADGLEEGALVVVGPSEGLVDGMKVTASRRDLQEAASATAPGSGG
ncbi:efflux RND transporter periplasmic adaptor subunit [bacterium]|nr:efflux RND transporter periplasmic adaptor subunit [bacterium]